MESFFSELAEKGHTIKETVGVTLAALEMQRMLQEAERDGQLESEAIQRKMMEKGMETMWKLGQMEIEQTVRSVCERVLRESSLTKKQREQRGQAIKKMGEVFMKIGKTKRQAPNLQDFGMPDDPRGSGSQTIPPQPPPKDPSQGYGQPSYQGYTPGHSHVPPNQGTPYGAPPYTGSYNAPSYPGSMPGYGASTPQGMPSYTQPTFTPQTSPYSKEELEKLSPKDLLSITRSRNIDTTGCIEKGDLISAILKNQ